MLHIGTAQVDITPPVGIPLSGYSREKPSQGILDRLSATAFVLQPADDSPPHVLLSIDHVGMVPAEVAVIQQHLQMETGLSAQQITLFFTHTHSGAHTEPDSENLLIHAYVQTLHANLVYVVREALADMQPCHAGWGMDNAHIGVNRRAHTAARPSAEGVTLARDVDNRVGILKFSHAEDGHLLAVLVIATAHANVLKGDNLLISADFPGAVRQLLDDVLHCPAMVIIGSAGDCNARWRGDVQSVRRMAQATAGSVLKTLSNIIPQPVEQFDVRETMIDLPLQDVPSVDRARHLAETASDAWGVDTGAWLKVMTALREAGQKKLSLQVRMQSIVMNEGAVTGVPMEPFASYALRVMHLLDNPLHFFVGYMNGWTAYLPSADEIPCGGYEIEWNPIVYGHESGFYMPLLPEAEQIVIDAVQSLHAVSSD
jgi:hypothetical protein